jgi:hypothetical protein
MVLLVKANFEVQASTQPKGGERPPIAASIYLE